MDDIPKIELKHAAVSTVSEPAQNQPEEISRPEPMTTKKKNKLIVPIIFLVIFVLLGGGVFAVLNTFIVWDDGSQVEESEASAYIPSKLPPDASEYNSEKQTEEVTTSAGVKGKLTATIMGDGASILDGGVIRLINSSGKTVKEVDTAKTGVAVFDGLPAGNYKVEGGKKGEDRMTSQSVVLGDGEIKEVTLTIFLNTNVTITVNVKNASGSPAANQTLTLRKIRSSESPLDYTVTTNDAGVFTQPGISPDNNWLLLSGDTTVGLFSVAPTGKNQTINVQTKSN